MVINEDVLSLVHKHSKLIAYMYDGKPYFYYDVPDELWKSLCDNFLKKKNSLIRLLIGGFVLRGDIYIKKGRKINRNKLILHEIGHVLGYHHTWKPTIMNPTWLFRLLNRW
jgi:hypothetical protein|tara:strand:- start:131 stop:463 length:333 start_codon:yes stop_codon:yes gene_type:complete